MLKKAGLFLHSTLDKLNAPKESVLENIDEAYRAILMNSSQSRPLTLCFLTTVLKCLGGGS